MNHKKRLESDENIRMRTAIATYYILYIFKAIGVCITVYYTITDGLTGFLFGLVCYFILSQAGYTPPGGKRQ